MDSSNSSKVVSNNSSTSLCFSAANLVFTSYLFCIFLSMGCCVITSVLQAEYCAFRFDDILNSLFMSGSPTCKWISYANYMSHQAYDFSLFKIFKGF